MSYLNLPAHALVHRPDGPVPVTVVEMTRPGRYRAVEITAHGTHGDIEVWRRTGRGLVTHGQEPGTYDTVEVRD